MGTMWGPQGCGDHVGDNVGDNMGDNMGDYRDVQTTWGQHGDNMWTT